MERQEIYKQLDDLIEKARSGVYSNTYENRKKGRVGQKYGSEKKGGGSKETKKVVDWDSVPKKIQREVNDIFKEMDFMTKDEKDKAEKYIDKLLKKYEVDKEVNKGLEPDIIKALGIEVEPNYTPLEKTLIKGFGAGIYDEDYLQKAMGSHKYFKREPKAGGGYKYYYTKEQYDKEKKEGGEKQSTEKKESGSKIFSEDELQNIFKGYKIKISGTEEKPIYYISKHSKRGDEFFMIQYDKDHPAGKYYLNMESKMITSSVSLADPRATYQTTSARRITTKKIRTVDYFDDKSKVLNKITKHLQKVDKI